MVAMVPCLNVFVTVEGNTMLFARYHSEHGFKNYMKRVAKISKKVRLTIRNGGCTTQSFINE